MQRTSTPWVIAPDGSPGYTWNVLTGCLGPQGDGVRCEWCFALRLAETRLRARYLANPNIIAGDPADPFAPRWWHERLFEPRDRRKPSGIFCCDMGDLWGSWGEVNLTPYWIDSHSAQELVLYQMGVCPQHRFYILTKWPQNLAKYNPWPPNVWVGATATDAATFLFAAMCMKRVEASVKFVSIEPLLGPIGHAAQAIKEFDWAIIGPATGPLASAYPCRAEWIVDIELAASQAGIPVFEKDACAKVIPAWQPRQEFPEFPQP